MAELTVAPPETQPQVPSFTLSRRLRARAHAAIPGGAHTYSKGDDQFPEYAPGFILRGKGCHVWDVDGNEFIEYGMGLRAVTLGHAHPAIIEAAFQQMRQGTNFTRPAALELEYAEALLDTFDGADMIKFTKDGSSATTAAIKLARAHTGRHMVAVCANHPFYSYDDWFIGSTSMHAGTEESARPLTVKFQYNNPESLRQLFEQYPDQIACVMMEPARTDEPRDGFLHLVQALCKKYGAVFVLDEMITGFRWHLKGAQHVYGVVPDLSTFGKGMGNGFSISALAGKRELMELGGLTHDRERVFLLSTTHGAETHALAAGLTTLRVYQEEPVIAALHRQGERLRIGIETIVDELHLNDYFGVLGHPTNLIYYTRDDNRKPSQPFRTLFLQELIKRGVIAPSLVVSYAHTDADIDYTIQAVGEGAVRVPKGTA